MVRILMFSKIIGFERNQNLVYIESMSMKLRVVRSVNSSLQGYHAVVPDDQVILLWLLNFLTDEKRDAVTLIVSVLWGIWFFRNKLVWENMLVTAKVATNWSTKMILD